MTATHSHQSALRRRAWRLAAAIGLLVPAVWVIGGLLHQDLFAGLLVVVAIVLGGSLLVTVVQLLTGKQQTDDPLAPLFDWDAWWEEEKENDPNWPGTMANLTYGQREHDDD